MTQQPRNPYGSDPYHQAGGVPRRRDAGGREYPQGAYRGHPEGQNAAYPPSPRQRAASREQMGRVSYGQAGGQQRTRTGGQPAQRPQAGYQGQQAYAGNRANPARRPANGRTGAGGRGGAAAPAYNRSRSQAARNRPAGTTEYSDYARYLDQRQQRRRKSPLAIVATLVVLAAIGVGVYLFLNPLSFEITVNGVTHTVDRGATLATALDEGMATPQPGNLLAIDGSVITEGGGDRFSATVNGEATNDETRELRKGDVVEIADGADATETFQSSTEEIPFTRVEDENYWSGSLHVYIAGANGVRTTKTGDVSGITLTEDTQPVVNEEYKIYNANVGDDKVIALTFDDGPWPDTTGQILDILEQNDAKATFFTIGNQIESHSDTVKRAHDAGHQICTHTWDHASGSGQGVNLTYMSADEQVTEVQKGMDAISAATGAEASRVMRAPGGNFFGELVWTLQPYITAEIGWNVDTEDWRRPGADVIAERILSAQPGDVILMHDGGGDRSQTVEALRQALPVLKEKGYRFVTVDELLAYGVPADGE